MTDTEKKLAFLLATSPHLDTVDGSYDKAARDLIAKGVEPVRQGRWEEWYPPKHMILTGEEMLFRCSECDAKYADVEGMRYCPYCGAKMDGGLNNGDEADN